MSDRQWTYTQNSICVFVAGFFFYVYFCFRGAYMETLTDWFDMLSPAITNQQTTITDDKCKTKTIERRENKRDREKEKPWRYYEENLWTNRDVKCWFPTFLYLISFVVARQYHVPQENATIWWCWTCCRQKNEYSFFPLLLFNWKKTWLDKIVEVQLTGQE